MSKDENPTDMHYLIIDEKQTTGGLQQEFNKCFPFLKLEFFREKIKKGTRDPKNLVISSNNVISQLQKKGSTGKIAFGKKTTVNELEKCFMSEYGINAQVFRKSGNVWLVTTSTDDWTLDQQNEEGQSLANHLKTEKENPDDHDIY